jgi:hypothetical protein
MNIVGKFDKQLGFSEQQQTKAKEKDVCLPISVL